MLKISHCLFYLKLFETRRISCIYIYIYIYIFIHLYTNLSPIVVIRLRWYVNDSCTLQTGFLPEAACLLNHFANVKGAVHSQLNWTIVLFDVISDGKTEWTAQFWQAIAQASELSFPVVFHTKNCAVHSGNPIVSSVVSKQQTRALFLSITVARTRIHTELIKRKLINLMGNLCCARDHSVQFFVQFFYKFKLHCWT